MRTKTIKIYKNKAFIKKLLYNVIINVGGKLMIVLKIKKGELTFKISSQADSSKQNKNKINQNTKREVTKVIINEVNIS